MPGASHFLESVVLQANAAHEQRGAEAREDHDSDEAEADGPEVEMTERFRAFADESHD